MLLAGSINRNIVECKEFMTKLDGKLTPGINRNIVECKVQISGGLR